MVATSLALLISLAQPTSVVAAGTWSATGTMTVPRGGHTATLLPTGKVLVSGGTSGGNNLASAELYDPALGTWSATGSMTAARQGHTATLLPSGKVLVAGGFGVRALQASAELYDPALGTWSATGTMTSARYLHTATLLPSGKVLVAGGLSSGPYLASAEVYDPALGTWSATGSMTAARAYHTATLLPSGKVLVAGGYNGSFLASAELYDPALGTWSATGSMTTTRYVHTATLLPSGNVLVAGGYTGGQVASASAALYDPALGTWSATGSMTAARVNHTATLLSSGNVLVAGGSYQASAEVYDPALGAWSATGSMTAVRVVHTATLLPTSQVLVAGGYDGHYLASAELYQDVGPPSMLTLAPPTATNTVGAQHCVTATVRDALGSPTPSITVRFTVPTSVATQANPSSGSAPTNTSGNATFCFSATLPGMDDIHAFADTDNDSAQDAGEPFGDATKTWVPPANTEFCEVMIKDIGRIIANNGDEARFTGHAKVKPDGTVQGEQHYEDLGPAQPLTVDATELTATTCSSNHTTATIFGQATINGAGSHTFRVDVTDGKSTGPDTYGITLDTGYMSGQHPLIHGKVTIQ